jgi:uncharacterized protein (TIGR03437 family)
MKLRLHILPILLAFAVPGILAQTTPAPTLSVANATMTFTHVTGAAKLPTAQTLNVRGTPNGLAFTASVSGPAPHAGAWLLLSATAGRAPQTLTLTVNPTGLPAGSYTATVTLIAGSGNPAPTATTTVTLNISAPPPTITVSPAALSFTYVTGEAVTGNSALTKSFVLSNNGGAIPATASVSGATWLRIAPTGNITLAGLLNTISVTADPTGLAPKVYTGTIKVESKQAANPSLSIAVTLTVQAAAPRVSGTWPLGVIQQSPASVVTLNGANFFSNSTASLTGFTNAITVSVNDGAATASETVYVPVYAPTTTALRVAMGSPLPGGTVGAVYLPVSLQAAGGTGPYAWFITGGTLPPGLTLSGNVLSGTPTTAGSYYFNLEAQDSALPFSARAYMPVKLTVTPAGSSSLRLPGPSAVIPAAATASAITPFSLAAAGGSGTYTYTASGLPPGLAFNATTATISGTPTTVGATGPLTANVVSSGALLATIPAPQLTTPGLIRIGVTTPAPGGGASNEGQFLVYGPQPQIHAVVNAASFQQGRISQGEIITLFGLGLGPASLTLFDPSIPAPQLVTVLPAAAPSTTITINGTPAPILYTSANQVAVIVPYTVLGPTVTILATYNSLQSQPFALTWAETNPGVFTLDSSGRGAGAILNYNSATNDYSLNSANNAAKKGDTVVIYVNGMGATNSLVANTLIPASPPVNPLATPSVTIGGQAAAVLAAVSPVGSVPGLLQLNVTVPANSPTGNVPVVVSFGTNDSQAGVTIAVK